MTSLLFLLVLVVVTELAARWWIRCRRACYVFPPGLRLRLHPDRDAFPELEPVVRIEIVKASTGTSCRDRDRIKHSTGFWWLAAVNPKDICSIRIPVGQAPFSRCSLRPGICRRSARRPSTSATSPVPVFAIEQFRIAHPVSPACARSLAAAFRRHRIVLAHSHEFSMAVYGAWASWYAGVPHVITMHGSRYYAARFRRRVALRA